MHLSAYGQYPSMTSQEQCWNANVHRTNRLLENAGRMIYAGTSVGTADKYPYGLTKAIASESVLKRGGVVLRLFSVYGPGELDTRLMPMVVRRGLDGHYPDFASADAAHDFVYVADVARAFVRAIEAKSWTYDIGTGVQTTIRDVAAASKKVFGIKTEPKFDCFPARSWDKKAWVADPRPAFREFGWKPMYGLEDGLCKMAEALQPPLSVS
jgi:dolichol-phosphate mannosyltransferase